MNSSNNVSISSFQSIFLYPKRNLAHAGAALATILMIGSALALVSLHHGDLGPLNALSQLTEGGAKTLLIASATVLGPYLIWRRFSKKNQLVILTNGKEKITYFRPGISKNLRNLFRKLNSADHKVIAKLKDKEHAFSNPNKPESINKNEDDLRCLWTKCKSKGLLKELYFEIVSHPSAYLFAHRNYFDVDHTMNQFVNLRECACETRAFNRLTPATHNRRKSFEKAIVKHVLKTVPDKNTPIRFIDMGCGHLLQSWMLVGLLMKEGYKNFEIELIDPYLDQDEVDNLKRFLNQFQGYDFKIEGLKSVQEVQPDFKADFVAAIDFDNFYQMNGTPDEAVQKDLATATDHLETNGLLFLGFGANQDYALSKSQLKRDESTQTASFDFKNARKVR